MTPGPLTGPPGPGLGALPGLVGLLGPVGAIGVVAWVVAGVVLVLALGSGPVLRRLPEPGPDHPGFDPAKTPYRQLAGRGFAARCAAAGGLAALLVTSTLPASLWPPWLVLATAGTLLAGIDAATTWLPWRLTWTTG